MKPSPLQLTRRPLLRWTTALGWRRGGTWGLGLLVVLLAGGVWADWWMTLPADYPARFVGRQRCLECHRPQARQFAGSHHDLAMQVATEATVLADFDDQSLKHFGLTSRMYRDGPRFMVETEGPDGAMYAYQVRYTFGVSPLQQYLVEMERPEGLEDREIGRLQVLPFCWDGERNQWFYLSPPDVQEKLAPDDPLHWTRRGQTWNHMCAECHSTNVQKNYDLSIRSYRTTFSEIDVSCEACHGPGSIHVELATSRSLFWDRRYGYGLVALNASDSNTQIHTCAVCHSRRWQRVAPDPRPGDSYYDSFANELITQPTYYADGQPKEEAYVYGSFLQSKMYANGVRCTDCHDPHTARLKRSGNEVCTSCHAHPKGKYDTPAHHHHVVGSPGAQCAACHMPDAPFMEIDWRRDHGFRIPRPQLSVELQTPNTCSQCHLDDRPAAKARKEELPHYWAWMRAAERGDVEARRELEQLDRWAAQWCETWYGQRSDTKHHFAHALAQAWEGDRRAVPTLAELSAHRLLPGIVRASTLLQLGQLDPQRAAQTALRLLGDRDPQVRAVAVALTRPLQRRTLVENVIPLLNDPIRWVRLEAVRVLAGLPETAFTADQRVWRRKAESELANAAAYDSDQAASHVMMGNYYQDRGELQKAIEQFELGIAVQPRVTGPRTNLSVLLESLGRTDRARTLARQELALMQRDAQLAPDSAPVHRQFGLALYRDGQLAKAIEQLELCVRLMPLVDDYWFTLAMLYEKQEEWDKALRAAVRAVALDPDNPSYHELERRLRQHRSE